MILRIRGIKRYASKGVVYYYHRKTKTRITEEPGTTAFFAKIKELNDQVAGKKPEIKAGTLGALIAAYKSDTNPEWKDLKPDTKVWYNRIFDYLRPIDSVLLAEIDPPYLMCVRAKCFAKHKRRFTNGVMSALSLMFSKMAVPNGWMTTDPAGSVPTIRRKKTDPKKTRRAWLPEEEEHIFSGARAWIKGQPGQKPGGTGMLVGIALAYWCGLSLKDVVEFPRALDGFGNGYNRESRKIIFNRSKTDVGGEVIVSETAATILDAELDRTKGQEVQPLRLVVNAKGKPFTRSGFQTNFQKIKERLGDKIMPGLTLHGARHTIGKDIIDAGGDEVDVASALAQETSAMGRHYSKQRDRAKRAGKALAEINKVREGRQSGRAS